MRIARVIVAGFTAASGLFAGSAHAITSPVPEPGTLILLASGAGALLLLARRKRNK